jgi:hypothetical protein
MIEGPPRFLLCVCVCVYLLFTAHRLSSLHNVRLLCESVIIFKIQAFRVVAYFPMENVEGGIFFPWKE